MSEEEKKAIEILRQNSIGRFEEDGYILKSIAVEDFKKILNLINNLYKENLTLKYNEKNEVIPVKKIEEKIDELDKMELLQEIDYSRLKFAITILQQLIKENCEVE